MMAVSIKFFASLAEKCGEKETIISLKEESTISDLLKKLSQKYGKSFQETVFQPNGNIKKAYKILLNETGILEQSMTNIKLKNKDIIAILPPIGGGHQ